jgi:hypothetical protein
VVYQGRVSLNGGRCFVSAGVGIAANPKSGPGHLVGVFNVILGAGADRAAPYHFKKRPLGVQSYGFRGGVRRSWRTIWPFKGTLQVSAAEDVGCHQCFALIRTPLVSPVRKLLKPLVVEGGERVEFLDGKTRDNGKGGRVA